MDENNQFHISRNFQNSNERDFDLRSIGRWKPVKIWKFNVPPKAHTVIIPGANSKEHAKILHALWGKFGFNPSFFQRRRTRRYEGGIIDS